MLELAQHIENNIVKETFKKGLAAFEKNMGPFKGKIHDLRKEVMNLLRDAQTKCNQYFMLYQLCLNYYENPVNAKPPPRADLLYLELIFIPAMQATLDKAKQLGKLTNEYWKASKSHQFALFEELRKGLKNYIEKVHEIHGTTGSGSNVQGPINLLIATECLKTFLPGKETSQHYDIDKLCQEVFVAMKYYLKQPIKDDEDANMKEFFEEKELPLDQSQKPLVKKEYEMQRDTGTISKEFHICVFYITVDNFLLVIDASKTDVIGKVPKYCMDLQNMTITKREGIFKLYNLVENGGSKILIDDDVTNKMDEIKGFLNLNMADAGQQHTAAEAGNN